jgi:hypothetical protein
VLQYLQTTQMHPCAYMLENVPPLGDSQLAMLVTWHQIWAWIGELMQMDVALINSCSH